jgi:hypothetical protein
MQNSEGLEAIHDLALQGLVLINLLSEHFATFLAATNEVGHHFLSQTEGHVLVGSKALSS